MCDEWSSWRRVVGTACLSVVAVAAGCRQAPAGAPAPLVRTEIAPESNVVRLDPTTPAALTGTIAFQSDRDGRPKLYALQVATGEIGPLTEGAAHRDETPEWSPDGRHVAFATTRFDAATYDIAVLTLLDRRLRRVTATLAFDNHPVWTSDGAAVFFSSERGGPQAIYRSDVMTGATERISGGVDRALMPALSPDDTRLAYASGSSDGLQIVIADAAGRAPHRITAGPGEAVRPRWSPDGRRIACVRLSGSGSMIEIIDVIDERAHRIQVEGLTALDEPAWAPGGRHLVAAGRTPIGDWDLIAIDVGDRAAFRLTRGAGNDRAPSWARR